MDELSKEIVIMKGINKYYPGVQALENVDFDLRRGEVHALVGENGAGKSTLIKVLTGVDQPDAGTIMLNQQKVTIRSPQASPGSRHQYGLPGNQPLHKFVRGREYPDRTGTHEMGEHRSEGHEYPGQTSPPGTEY